MDKGKSTGAYRKTPQDEETKTSKSKSKRSGAGPEQQYPVKEGWLQWRCSSNDSGPGIVDVWCVVENGIFYLYRERDTPRREIAALPLRDAVVQEHPGDGDPESLPQLEFAIRCHSLDQRFHLRAKSLADRAVWLSAVTIFTKQLYTFMNNQTENVQYPTFPSRHNRKIMKRVSLGNRSKNSVQRRDSLRTVVKNAGKTQISWHELEVVKQSNIYERLNTNEIEVESARFRLVASEIILNKELNNLLLLIQEAEKWKGTLSFNTRGSSSMYEDVKQVKKYSDGLLESLEETWQSKLLFTELCKVLESCSQKYDCIINYCRHLPLYMDVLNGIRHKMADRDSLFFSTDFNIETVYLPILKLKMMQSFLEELRKVLEETNHHMEYFHCSRTIANISKVIDKCYKELRRACCSKFDDTLDLQLQKCYVNFIQSKFVQRSEVESVNCADSSLSVSSNKPHGRVQTLQSSIEMKSSSIYSPEGEAPSIEAKSTDRDLLKTPDDMEVLSIINENSFSSSPPTEQKSHTDRSNREKQPLILMDKEGESEVSSYSSGNQTNNKDEVKTSCSVQYDADSLHPVYSGIKNEALTETEGTIICSSLKGYKDIPSIPRTRDDAAAYEEHLQNVCKEEPVHTETAYEPNDTIIIRDNDNVSHSVLVVNCIVPDKDISGKGFDNKAGYENSSESGSLDDICNIPAPTEDEMKCFSITEVLNIDSSLDDDSDDVLSYSSPDGHIYYEMLEPSSNQESMSPKVDEDICNNAVNKFIVQAVNEYVVCSKSTKNNISEYIYYEPPLHQESADACVYEEINYESLKEMSENNLVQPEEPIYSELDQFLPSDRYIYDDVGNTTIHSTGAIPKKYRTAQVSERSTDSLDLGSDGDYETNHYDRDLSLGCELNRETELLSQMKRSTSSASLSLHSMKKWSKSMDSSEGAEAAERQADADELFSSAFGEAPLHQDYRYVAPSLVDDGKSFHQTHPEDPSICDSTDESPLETYLSKRHFIAVVEKDSNGRSRRRTYTQRAQWCETQEVIQSGCLESMELQKKRLQEAKFEIITSEVSFYKSLCILKKYYIDDSYLANSGILTSQERLILFSSVSTVLSVSECFLRDLVQAWEQDIMLTNLHSVIQKHAKLQFRGYIAHCSAQVDTNELLIKLRGRNKKFNDALERIQTNPACEAFSLQSFLTQPMQRITRFPLLVEAIIAYMNEEDEEYSRWKKLHSLLKRVALECNEAVRDAERKSEERKESSKLKYYWNRLMK